MVRWRNGWTDDGKAGVRDGERNIGKTEAING